MAVDWTQNYYANTKTLISKIKPSLTSYFSVYIIDNNSPVLAQEISFLAYEAVLPGTSFELGQVYGDRQGLTEQYPTKRVFPAVDVSFYINSNYKTIEYFEYWIDSISSLTGSSNTKNSTNYYKFNYPDTYEKDVVITKYERDFHSKSNRLLKKSQPQEPTNIQYTLLNAYPVNIISIPVSFGESELLRTTITFNYDRYTFNLKPRGKTVSTTKINNTQSKPEPKPGGNVVPIQVIPFRDPNETEEQYYNRIYGEA